MVRIFKPFTALIIASSAPDTLAFTPLQPFVRRTVVSANNRVTSTDTTTTDKTSTTLEAAPTMVLY